MLSYSPGSTTRMNKVSCRIMTYTKYEKWVFALCRETSCKCIFSFFLFSCLAMQTSHFRSLVQKSSQPVTRSPWQQSIGLLCTHRSLLVYVRSNHCCQTHSIDKDNPEIFLEGTQQPQHQWPQPSYFDRLATSRHTLIWLFFLISPTCPSWSVSRVQQILNTGKFTVPEDSRRNIISMVLIRYSVHHENHWTTQLII